jgi:hypothetical protein
MHTMMNDRMTHLALKLIVGQATDAERTELDSAFEDEPKLRAEFEQLRASASSARQLLPIVAAMETATGEFPTYARERLQTKVRQTLGRPPVPQRKIPWVRYLFFALVPATAAVVLLLVVLPPRGPVIQVAVLDTVGRVRGQGPRDNNLIQDQWKGTMVLVFSNAQELASWENSWPGAKASVAKVIFDPAAAEVRVLVRSGDTETQKVIPVQRDLRTALREAETFVAEQTKRNGQKRKGQTP